MNLNLILTRKPVNWFGSAGIILTLLLFMGANTALADNCNVQPVVDLTGGTIGGTAEICQTPGGLKAHLKATGLTAGDAYTVWWIYIDDPSQCDPDPEAPPGFECDYSFFFNDGDPLGVLGRFDSGIAPGSGKIHFKDHVNDMHVSGNSMIWLIINAHGEGAAGGRALARQLLTPEDAIFGAPHLGIDGGIQAIPAAGSFHLFD